MRKIFLLSALLSLGFSARAQYVSHGGMFKVDQIRGCAPFTIKITATNLDGSHACTSGPSGTPCVMSFDGTGSCPPNTSCQNVTQFTYNTAKTYRLQVIYQGGIADYIDVTVDPNIQPAFDIYSCAGSKVQINVTDRNYDSYDINFNSEADTIVDKTISAGPSQVATYSYGATGVHTIAVRGKKTNAASNCNQSTQPFTAITTLPVPSINSLTAKSVDSLNLVFTPVTNIDYKSEIATNNVTNFIGYPIQYGTSSFTVPNVNLDNNYYCLRMNSFDPCANINKYSAPVCSQNFDVTAINGVDQLTWMTASLGISKIRIRRNNAPYDSVAGTATSYNDDSITCKKDYTYQLVSKYASGAISTSLKKLVKAVKTTTPTPINNTSAVVSEPKVDLVWLQDPAFTVASYEILRGHSGGSYFPIGNSTSPMFTDLAYNNAAYCYQINYTDNCGNASDKGLPACPILLTGALDASNDVTLNWSAYEGWNLGVGNYKLLRYYEPGQTPTVFSMGLSTTKFDQPGSTQQVIYYKVEAIAAQPGVSPSQSNEIKVVRNINLYYPTAFNPESKISQDKTFTVRGHFISYMKLQIFDRWGSLVFYSDENDAWDGKKEGQPMPDATYVWTADGTDMAGNSFKRAGTVILLRK